MKKQKPSPLKENIYTSKADVLKFLEKQLNHSKIESIYDFTVKEWRSNPEKILSYVKSNFKKKKLIIRSSAKGEDSEDVSEAGKYESILNVNSNSKSQLISGINAVIHSYEKNNNFDIQNQILIQPQTLNIISSGVLFTRTPEYGSPYYVVNYEDGASTTGVTHGSINKMIKISRYIEPKNLEKKWKMLLKSVKEIEKILHSNSLDIEFGITKKHTIIIFQVRPMTSITPLPEKLDFQIKKMIFNNKKLYLKSQSSLSKKPLIFSDMSDWNPAEILGNNPNALDYSLYDYLIMKDAWYEGRVKLGYQKFSHSSLMSKFGNKPYVNTHFSFNSLIPEKIPDKLKKKLMTFYLKKLENNSHYHDKVEFEILFSSYDLLLKKRLRELKKYNFSNNDIKIIYDILLNFTESIIQNFSEYKSYCENCMKKLNQNRLLNLKKIQHNENYLTKLKIAKILLDDCKSIGTIPFSLMARIAFIGNSFLKSFVAEQYMSKINLEKFMNSLDTPLSDFQNDLNKLYSKNISKKDFLKKYGHLRPGTYDITISRYDKENPFLNDIKIQNHKSFKINFQNNSKIDKTIKSNFSFSTNHLFLFIKDSLKMREEIKFEFTKNLSDALELIADAGNDLGFSRDDMSHLNINTIFSSMKKFDKQKLKHHWKEKMLDGKRKNEINSHLVLPPVISSKNDFDFIRHYSAKPNYITKKSIKSEIFNLDNTNKYQKLENKIILLENADPGFDWIFSRNPAGLITKYGGVASHMSIRCSELNLPAAIGCGEIIYNALQNSSSILLDCNNQQIIILKQKKYDKFFEEKKLLKSLGYIK